MFTGLFIASFHPEGMEIPETIPFLSGIAQLGSGEGGCPNSFEHFMILTLSLKWNSCPSCVHGLERGGGGMYTFLSTANGQFLVPGGIRTPGWFLHYLSHFGNVNKTDEYKQY